MQQRSAILEQFSQMASPLEPRIEALEDEVRILKILCKSLAEKCQQLSDSTTEYER